MGLFEIPYADTRLQSFLGARKHRALARGAVRKSRVLLKNGNRKSSKPLLPLRRNVEKILVVGAHANDIGLQSGGAPSHGKERRGTPRKGTTILEGIKEAVHSKTEVLYSAFPKAGDARRGYEYAIVVVGEQPYAEGNGDNRNLTLPDPYPEMIKDTCGEVDCVVVMVSGRPLVVEELVEAMDAFVAAWLPGSEGGGVADVLFGKHEFEGTLARTWLKRADQLPMNVGDEDYDPLYPFGFGLKMGLKGKPEH